MAGTATQGFEPFFVSDSEAGIRPDHASRLKRQLARLDEAQSPQDMNMPGWRLYPLHKDLEGHFSVWISGNWRVTFTF
ncbi:type II toxin-antitoxin system RelE/ParE family toxin [Paraburkholderia sp. Cpub6]|uniref:type II toxin-antitoxin system RelE/ParE family toxin n=1 Tax=Paraburkholderia sp. Cpub6 TaxID=2723094 RepID=UPI0016214AEB|nr:type II toxin-antitoxin system RelE/ParE family toxin [Paraburkholderia sp. Cpub6]